MANVHSAGMKQVIALAKTNLSRWQRVAITALSLSYKTLHTCCQKRTVGIDRLIWLTRRTPGSYSHLEISSIKAPFDCDVGRCVWSVPPLRTVARKMRWRHKNLNGPRTIGRTPLSACSQRPWEALAGGKLC